MWGGSPSAADRDRPLLPHLRKNGLEVGEGLESPAGVWRAGLAQSVKVAPPAATAVPTQRSHSSSFAGLAARLPPGKRWV